MYALIFTALLACTVTVQGSTGTCEFKSCHSAHDIVVDKEDCKCLVRYVDSCDDPCICEQVPKDSTCKPFIGAETVETVCDTRANKVYCERKRTGFECKCAGKVALACVSPSPTPSPSPHPSNAAMMRALLNSAGGFYSVGGYVRTSLSNYENNPPDKSVRGPAVKLMYAVLAPDGSLTKKECLNC